MYYSYYFISILIILEDIIFIISVILLIFSVSFGYSGFIFLLFLIVNAYFINTFPLSSIILFVIFFLSSLSKPIIILYCHFNIIIFLLSSLLFWWLWLILKKDYIYIMLPLRQKKLTLYYSWGTK